MKKLFFPLIAVVLALVFSAFTQEKKAKTPALYWYDVVYSGTYPDGAIMPGGPDYTGLKAEVDENIECTTGDDICVAGFDSPPTFPNGGLDPLEDFSAATESFDFNLE